MDPHRVVRLGFCVICLLAFFTASAKADNDFTISAPAFRSGMPMPVKFGHHQQNISPELQIKNIPAGAKSLMLIVDDPDAPSGLWTHWLVWNLPANTISISEGKLPPNAVEGKNSNGNVRYDGPAPPSGTHRYYFHLSTLDTMLSLPVGASRSQLEKAASGHILQQTETFGTYRSGLTMAH
jgi:Raf kinase inhibitor-like YbhB/YbcL family protein